MGPAVRRSPTNLVLIDWSLSEWHGVVHQCVARAVRRHWEGVAMTTSAMLWVGRVLTGLFALFMLGASIAPKLLGMPVAEETMAQLGWPAGFSFMIGLVELTCLSSISSPGPACSVQSS